METSLDQPLKLHEAELPADDGGDGERLVAASERRSRRLPITSRAPPRGCECPRSPAAEPLRRQLALLNEQPDDLGDEERVALRLRVDHVDELRRWCDAARCLDEAADVLLGQAAQQDPLEAALAAQLGECLRERVPARELDVAVGADEQQARAGELARDELEQAQRSLVRPVQIVEHEHERLRFATRSSGRP